MWLFSAPPRAQVKAKYGFELTDAWLDHLMRSSVRFNSGGFFDIATFANTYFFALHHFAANVFHEFGIPRVFKTH